jgi:hypothetical protein
MIARFTLPDSYTVLFSLTSSWRIVWFEISPQCHIPGTSLHPKHGCNLSWASISVVETTDFSYTVHFCSASRDWALYFMEITDALERENVLCSAASVLHLERTISVINRCLDQHRTLMPCDRLWKGKPLEMCKYCEFYAQSSWNIRIMGKSYSTFRPPHHNLYKELMNGFR